MRLGNLPYFFLNYAHFSGQQTTVKHNENLPMIMD
jgi:hypothetical protein